MTAAWAVVLVALSALHLTNVSSGLGGNLGGDNAVYYLLAKAIATGQGYVDLYLPGHPAQVKFPPLFPLLLAPFHLLFNNPFPAMHAMVALGNVLACVVLGIWAGRRLGSHWLGLALALVIGTMPKVYLQSAHLLSEPLYMALCYLALLALPEEKDAAIGARRFAVLVIAVLAAYFTRTAGFMLAAAVTAALVLHRDSAVIGKRGLSAGAALAGIFVAAAALWFLRNLIQSGAGMVYLTQFAQGDPSQGLAASGPQNILPRVLDNASYYLPLLGRVSFTPAMYFPLPAVVAAIAGCVIAAVIGAGIVLEFRARRTAAGLFVVLSLLMAVFWPFRDDRFLLPVEPLAVYFLFRAVDAGARAIRARAARPALAVLAALILAANAWVTGHYVGWRFTDAREPRAPVPIEGYGAWTAPVINWSAYEPDFMDYPPELIDRYLDYIIMNRALASLTPPGAVIMSRKPMLTYLYSGRVSVPLLYDPLPEKQWQYIEEKKVGYIVTGVAEDQLRAVMERWPGRFETVARIAPGSVKLIRVRTGSSTP